MIKHSTDMLLRAQSDTLANETARLRETNDYLRSRIRSLEDEVSSLKARAPVDVRVEGPVLVSSLMGGFSGFGRLERTPHAGVAASP